MSTIRTTGRTLLLVSLTGLAGCLAAAAAGAGGAIVLSGHTAEAIVERPVDEVASVAEAVMAEEDVEVIDTRTEDRGAKRVFEGDRGDLDVTVTIEREDEGTKIGVEAQRSTARWDDDYARSLLAKIIERAGA